MAVSKKSSKSPRIQSKAVPPRRKRVKLTYNRAIQRPARREKIAVSSPPQASIKSHKRSLDILAKAFFVLGFVLLILYGVLRVNQEIQLSYVTPKGVAEKKQSVEAKQYAIPTQIVVNKVNIDLPIEQTAINNGVWQIGQNGASHLNISARPGEQGAIIMYGHNTNDRFGPIRWLGKDDRIDLITADGQKHSYKITETMRVKPDKMDVFTQDRGEVLILYTCDGFADLERFIVIAKPL